MTGIVGGMAGLFFLIVGGRVLFLKPLREIDLRTAAARAKIAKIQDERRAYFAAEDRLKALATRTFGETVEQASAVSGELLTRQIIASGLQETDFSRLPSGPRKLRGASEIGWNIQGEGSLTNVINLLFLLDSSPWLHRMENLTVVSGDSPGRVRVHFRYLTLVMDPPLQVTHTNLVAAATLDSPDRRLLDTIAARDLMRPYIKMPPSPPSPPSAATAYTGPSGPGNYRVVSLSEWEGQPEIHVRDLAAQKTTRFKPGDKLAGGTVVMVDYRPMPEPGNPMLQSLSRIILKIDQDYWAIERGKTLADKHKLSQAELPPELAGAAKP
ncbi:MAG: hypothetical protein ACLQVY_11285 [Limisphaerales bacterium]